MKSTIFPTLTVLLFLTGCNPTSENSDHAAKDEVSTEAPSAPTELELNKGEKWPVNAEMMVHVALSDSLVKNFEANTEDGHAKLAEALEDQKNHLISSCTMKGPAHDALHLWLMPYIGDIDQLAEAETEAEKEQALADLQQSFDTFHSYFE